MINQIMKLFKIHFTAEAELIDGTKLFVDGDLTEGTKIFVVTQDGNVALPDGEYELKDGSTLICKEGIIETLNEKQPEDMVEDELPAQDDTNPETQIEDIPSTEQPEEATPAKSTENTDTEVTNKIKKLEERIKQLEELISEKLTASEERLENLNNQINSTLDKITMAKEIQRNQIENDDTNLSLFEKRMKYISEIRNKK